MNNEEAERLMGLVTDLVLAVAKSEVARTRWTSVQNLLPLGVVGREPAIDALVNDMKTLDKARDEAWNRVRRAVVEVTAR